MFLEPVDSLDLTLDALARQFAERAGHYDRTAEFPFENFEALRKAGVPGLVVPERFGGRGFGLRRALRVVGRVARGDSSTALVLAQQYLFHGLIARSESFPDALAERIFRSATQDGAFVNSLRVEPDLGTPARGGLPATLARRIPGGWRLTGRKIYATGCPILSWSVVWARTDEASPRVGQFVVPGGAKGLRVEETWRQMGMRASGSHDVWLEDVEIGDENVGELYLAGENPLADPLAAAWTAALFSAVYDGAARAARDWVVKFLRERKPANLGAPLASLPRMQEAVGEIDAALYASGVLLDDLGARADRGAPGPAHEVFYVKRAANEAALAAVSKALEISGNPGLSQNNPLERLYRDVLCARIHSPQNDSVLVAGGKAALFGRDGR